MGFAFEMACATLNLEKDGMERVQVAETVIAFARRGVKDADKLAAATIEARPCLVVRVIDVLREQGYEFEVVQETLQ